MMDRAIIDLPCGLFGPLNDDWILNVRGRAAADGVTGVGQVIYGSQPRWEATLDLSGFGRDRVLSWRSIRAKMRGRINILRVCMCDRWRPKYSELGLSKSDIAMLTDGIPHSDDVYFDTDVGYDYVPSVTTATDYDAGDETITVDATGINDALTAGQWFSCDDWPYQVTGISGTIIARTYEFEPPLRRDIPSGSTIIIGEATGLFAFIDDLQGRMPLELGKHGQAQIQLVEWTNRP
jgi:hypothetical protein